MISLRSVLFIVLATFAVLAAKELLDSGEAEAAPYCDPRANRTCFIKWCESQGGRVDWSAGVACVGAGGRGGSSSGYSDAQLQQALETVLRPAANAMGEMLRDFIFGNPEKEAAKRRQQEEYQQQVKQQQYLRDQKEAVRRQKFDAAKRRILGASGSGGLAPRDFLGGGTELVLEEKTGAFGTVELRPRDFSSEVLRPRRLAGAAPLTAVESARCAAHIMRMADASAAQGDFHEAAYLSNEVSVMMGGSGTRPAVECPAMAKVNDAAGGATAESAALAEKAAALEEQLRKKSQVSSLIYSRATQQIGDYSTAFKAVSEAEVELEDARTVRAEAEREVQELETRATTEEPEVADQSAMEEALAALEEAKASEQDFEALVAERQESLSDIAKQVEETGSIASDLTENPGDLDSILERLGVEPG